MARKRAHDYEAKRDHLLHTAAALFARHGYDRTSLAMIGEAAGVSKGLVYHYYADKDAVLADIIGRHLRDLVAVVEEVGRRDARDPATRLADMAVALLEAYRDADDEHRVQVAHLRLLPEQAQEALKALERRLVDLFAAALAEAEPALAGNRRLLKPLTMSLFGMLNWAFMWFRDDGPLARAEYARMCARMVLAGARDATAGKAEVLAGAR
ncbi:TetR/AcrR family transcriptional regulator [Elioraea thermophila]|uniref:TetR/AcrR family transcriptional regulator n=1 Tax=Elioraea thermophila TaxID=2185104 RepID=UPI000DF179BA|nr:TetR/AcrR family transcriptional regulator [Elioraea thermophila]